MCIVADEGVGLSLPLSHSVTLSLYLCVCYKGGTAHTVSFVSHVHEHVKLWASISPLVEQLQ